MPSTNSGGFARIQSSRASTSMGTTAATGRPRRVMIVGRFRRATSPITRLVLRASSRTFTAVIAHSQNVMRLTDIMRRRLPGAGVYWPTGPMTRSAEFARSHGLPPVSVIPCDSMTMTGYWRPVTVPTATSFGGAVSETLSVLLSRLRKQFALTVQATSPTVCDIPEAHVAGGPDCDAGAPQSSSENLITAPLSFTGKIGKHTSELQSPMYLVCRLLLEK